jgi:hypothetical protein
MSGDGLGTARIWSEAALDPLAFGEQLADRHAVEYEPLAVP